MSKKTGSRVVISGAILAAIGLAALIVNVFNVYGKASTNCLGNSSCTVSDNLLIAHIGIVACFAGLVLIVFGIVVLIVSSRHK